jgi:hypothetical protein
MLLTDFRSTLQTLKKAESDNQSGLVIGFLSALVKSKRARGRWELLV